jgi:MFS superfamily sulfate permease-like transporter
MAALVVTAIAIPESLGFAIIVGLPVQAGLYCALLAPIIFAMFTSSKHLVVGADSATAALVAVGATTIASAAGVDFTNAVAILGIVTAVMLFAMSAARLGFLADLISRPVLVGFISGVGVQLIVGKLPEMLGLQAHGNIFEKFSFLITHLGSVEIVTATLSAILVGIVILGWKLRWPGALIALTVSILGTKFISLQMHGVETIGIVPHGLPAFHLPDPTLKAMVAGVPIAFSIALVILAQSLAVIRSSAARYEEKVNDNQDLFALGMANAVSALIGGFAINGSPPRTSASEMAGGRSQLVNIFMSVLIGIVLLFATGMFEYVPIAALAAIVFTIGLHLCKIQAMRDILRVRPSEFAVSVVALGAVAFLGVQRGVMIAVAISLVDRLRRQYRPNHEVLLQDQQFTDWAYERIGSGKHGLEAPEGLLVYRFNDSLFFENAGYFLECATAVLAKTKQDVSRYVLDVGAMNDIDYTAAQVLRQFYNQLNASDIELAIAHASPKLRSLLTVYGLTDAIGAEHIYPSVRSAIKDYTKATVSSLDRIQSIALDPSAYIVIGGAAMELRGIRRTNDVDLVVSKVIYQQLQTQKWKEFVLDDGKKVLSSRGYKVMLNWMGRDLHDLRKSQELIDDVPVMGLRDLIDCKTNMGRKKDIADIKLLRNYYHLELVSKQKKQKSYRAKKLSTAAATS